MGVGADLSLFNSRAFRKGEVDAEGEDAFRTADGPLALYAYAALHLRSVSWGLAEKHHLG
jgi:hypothetical protein